MVSGSCAKGPGFNSTGRRNFFYFFLNINLNYFTKTKINFLKIGPMKLKSANELKNGPMKLKSANE